MIMVECKNCHSVQIIKSGFVRGKQRYKCKECGVHFVEGDARTSDKIAALKALCVVFYALGKGSYNRLGKIFGRNRSLIYRWIREAGLRTGEPAIDGGITQIEFDEMWHFIESKKESFGSSKPWIAVGGGRSPGFSGRGS
jgi:transposase-like protein